MGVLSDNQEKYKNLLCNALQQFYKNDAKALFNKNRGNTVVETKKEMIDERAMVGCVYRYMWHLMQQARDYFPVSDIDIEYDRMIKDNIGYYEKVLSCECISEDAGKQCYAKCCQVIINEINKNRRNAGDVRNDTDIIKKAVRPDIIVHNRNKGCIENNGLVAEFKKYNNKGVEFDKAKLYYFTCPKSKYLCYKLGAMVLLCPQYAYVGFICEQNILSGCKVCATGVKKVGIEDIEKVLSNDSFKTFE